MDWRNLPSLAALRAFEAAGRTGSLSRAAAELNVTHAAIAQHVRTVEDYVGRPVLTRAGRGMALTDAGSQLHPPLAEAFAQIASALRDAADLVADAPLAVTVTPSFAEYWLMPRLSGFWTAHPEITVSVTPSMGLANLARDGFDIAIRYGRGDWPGYDATFLASADYVVVGSPTLLQGRTAETISDLDDLPWLFETLHRETRLWAMESGLDPACCTLKELATLSMVISATRAGGGLSIQSRALVEADIANGQLVAVMEAPQAGLGYYIVTRKTVLSDRQKTFIRWLKSVA